MKSPFFIIGTQRSGTTLLRLILNSHSKIAVPEEGTFLMPLLKKKYLNYTFSGDKLAKLIDYISKNPQFDLWSKDFSQFFDNLKMKGETNLRELIIGLYQYYAKKEGKIFWGDKTPSFFRKIDILKELIPEAKFIHIVRDGRDVFDSWRRMDLTKNNAPVIALDWMYKIVKIENSFMSISSQRKITIRYEDLLNDPIEIISNICRFMEIEFEPEMLEFYKTSKKYIGKHYSPLIYGPITRENTSKWKTSLTALERDSFTLIAKKYLKKYSYEIPSGYLNLRTIIYSLIKLILGLPVRAYQVTKAKYAYEASLKKGKQVKGIKFGEKPDNG